MVNIGVLGYQVLQNFCFSHESWMKQGRHSCTAILLVVKCTQGWRPKMYGGSERKISARRDKVTVAIQGVYYGSVFNQYLYTVYWSPVGGVVKSYSPVSIYLVHVITSLNGTTALQRKFTSADWVPHQLPTFRYLSTSLALSLAAAMCKPQERPTRMICDLGGNILLKVICDTHTLFIKYLNVICVFFFLAKLIYSWFWITLRGKLSCKNSLHCTPEIAFAQPPYTDYQTPSAVGIVEERQYTWVLIYLNGREKEEGS